LDLVIGGVFDALNNWDWQPLFTIGIILITFLIVVFEIKTCGFGHSHVLVCLHFMCITSPIITDQVKSPDMIFLTLLFLLAFVLIINYFLLA
jgi:hypothetical protein